MESTKETGSEDIEYVNPLPNRHPSKQSVFRNECGSCGKPLKRNTKNKIGYLCRRCGPTITRNNNIYSICYYCPFEMDCTLRVQVGIWVRCETPDIGDLERLQFSGGLNDEKVRAELEKAMAHRGNRKILETAISQSTPKVYQDVIKRMQRQMP